MGTALIKLKIMPENLDTDLESIKQAGKIEIEKIGGEVTKYEEQPIAFGLNALIAFTRLDESKQGDIIEEAFKSIPGVSSVDVIDYRRAIE